MNLCGNILDKEKADTSAFVYIDYNDVCGRIRQCNRQNFQRICIDYIQTSFINFPVFNIADIGITVGAILLVAYFIWFDKEDKNADVKN